MTDTPSQKYVFMSYSRRDEAVMQRVTEFLRGQGINVWVDNEKLVPGTPIWEVEIEKAIKSSSAVIVILSPDSKGSEWVRREITLADQYHTRIFSVLVRGDEDSSIPLRLITSQYVDIRENEKIGFDSLGSALPLYLEELESQKKAEHKAAERTDHIVTEKKSLDLSKRKNVKKSLFPKFSFQIRFEIKIIIAFVLIGLSTFGINILISNLWSGPAYECTDEIGCVDIAPDEPVHIAYALTISGATAYLGEDSQGAIEIAIDDRGGELLGHPISLTGEDSLCSAEGGQTAATKIAADPTVLGVIGTNCSSAAIAALPTLSGAGLVMLSPSNTAPALTLEGETWQPGYFRICHTDLFQGSVAAEFAYNELGARTAATIHDGSPYADQLQQVFAGRFQELGGTVVFQGAVNVGDTDMRTVLTSVAADSPDVLYLPLFEPEGPFIVAQSSKIAGLENTTLMGADGLLSDSFPENAGPNVVGMYLSGPYVSGAAYDDFLAKWKTKFGGDPPSGFHAFAYDATNILLDAIVSVAIVDNDGTVHVGRQALRDAITATDTTGLSGKINCGDKNFGELLAHGDCATGEALGIFEVTQAEVDGDWPPPVVYTP